MENGYNTGEIKHPERFNQPLLFKGMSRGKLSPTDIDAVFEYKDKGYIFYEVKHKSVKNIPLGQDIL
ncbi:hypothetical protein, partial [Salmonella enterica]|uniref:hypothetical protein n=1 Tax=Salmonella enterica TaxID=28901 RepID=UPI000CC37529